MLNDKGERVLVYLAIVDGIEPIYFTNAEGNEEEASAIEKLITGGWNLVVKKNVFEKGQLFVYAETDTILPKDVDLFSFLEGKRIKTKKLKGVVSQGVAFTIPEMLDVVQSRMVDKGDESLYPTFEESEWNEGDDWTELVGATKYDEYSTEKGDNNGARTLPSEAKGRFPAFIQKTDEERIQNLNRELRTQYIGKKVVSREKLHGSSITIYCKIQKSVVEGLPNILDYGICSRNLDLKLDSDNAFIRTGIPVLKKLVALCNQIGESIAIQGELIGPGINGNPYALPDHQIKFFTAQNLDTKKRDTDAELMELLAYLDEDACPLVEVFELDGTQEQLLYKAEAKSVVNPRYDREGIVVRDLEGAFSFKVISNKFLLKEKD